VTDVDARWYDGFFEAEWLERGRHAHDSACTQAVSVADS
jgi:hypothetical protein